MLNKLSSAVLAEFERELISRALERTKTGEGTRSEDRPSAKNLLRITGRKRLVALRLRETQAIAGRLVRSHLAPCSALVPLLATVRSSIYTADLTGRELC